MSLVRLSDSNPSTTGGYWLPPFLFSEILPYPVAPNSCYPRLRPSLISILCVIAMQLLARIEFTIYHFCQIFQNVAFIHNILDFYDAIIADQLFIPMAEKNVSFGIEVTAFTHTWILFSISTVVRETTSRNHESFREVFDGLIDRNIAYRWSRHVLAMVSIAPKHCSLSFLNLHPIIRVILYNCAKPNKLQREYPHVCGYVRVRIGEN